jgi:hypothetical protein
LGIGANTAIFSVVDSVLLAPLPFRHPERLAIVWESNPELAAKVGLPDKLPVSPGTFYGWKTARSFSRMAMVRGDRLSFTGRGEPELLGTVGVSGEFFRVLGAPALVGRTLLPEDDDKGKATTVVLSHAFWQRRFGGDRGVVGRTIRLDGEPLMVVGVMPPEFNFPRGAEMPRGLGFAAQPEVWVPWPCRRSGDRTGATDPTTFAAVALALAVVSLPRRTSRAGKPRGSIDGGASGGLSVYSFSSVPYDGDGTRRSATAISYSPSRVSYETLVCWQRRAPCSYNFSKLPYDLAPRAGGEGR